jgi:hypothetical protein
MQVAAATFDQRGGYTSRRIPFTRAHSELAVTKATKSFVSLKGAVMLCHLCSGVEPISEDRILMQRLLAVGKDAVLGLKHPTAVRIAGPTGEPYRVVMADPDELPAIREALRALDVPYREHDICDPSDCEHASRLNDTGCGGPP